ncbi:diaminohydroxyphosphoribosylamino-pyrimidine deaminase, partial [Punctularia strigosozonata HHB-11173 SS5]|uniref:diaminohydroxyphosphoribosylamino-pyrimidine deaminase n=1 Tax=Punctularia strigosozonata (strain HHB-11173) TaxID=741275 RepID=UPI0004416900
EERLRFIRLALKEARKCTPTKTAFCVGCIITIRYPPEADASTILSTGYSRELPGNTHAEANALAKARAMTSDAIQSLFPTHPSLTVDELLAGADVYTTLEPCSVRTSGLAPCADALIAANIRRCIIGVGEPEDFVVCEGARKLRDAGIEVVWLKGLEEECLKEARRGH